MSWRHLPGITVVTTFAFILVVACQYPAAADCGDPPGPRDCVADLDGDGDTDLTDLGILLADWGCGYGGQPDCPGDVNGDGRTDSSDLGMLLADWGCPDGDPGCDGEPSDALGFDVVAVDNSSVQPGDDDLAPEFAGGVTHFTFDLQVIVPEDDDWTAAQAEAVLSEPSLTFFDHVFGDDTPPMAAFVTLFPAMEFDSFYASTEPDASNQPPRADPSFADLTNQAQYRYATWFHTPPNGDAGVFTIARYTIVVPEGSPIFPGVVPAGEGGGAPIIGTLAGAATSKVGWGACNTFAFDIVHGCAPDLDHDLDVDQADLGILLADWGCTFDCVGDVDGDDDTDQADLGLLLATWGALCGPDCNGNGISDRQDINDGTSEDCNENWIPDECDIGNGISPDCNGNAVPDECDLDDGTSEDCNENGVPDECEVGGQEDCNENGIPDLCDIYDGTSADCNENGVPDECEEGWELDCNENGAPDFCDLYDGTSQDFNNNGVPDECEENRTFYVDDDAPNDPGPGDPNISDPDEDGTPEHPYDAIQEAMDPSISGDTILVAEGVYTGTGNKEIDFGGRDVLLCSVSGPQTCTIDMEGTGRGFFFQSGETRAAQITGFTVSNGSADQGAGIRCENGSSPTVTDCIISGNTADGSGGGVRCRDSDPAFIDCIIAGNSGRGISCRSGDSTFTNCIVAGNSGGGIRCNYSDSTFINCIIAGNSDDYRGGGISCYRDDSTFTNCLIAGNSAGPEGGGLYCRTAAPTLLNCTFTGNAANRGGAVCCHEYSSPVLANCVLWGDTPQEIYVFTGSPQVSYSDIEGGWSGTGNIDADPLFVDPDGPDDDPDTWEDNDYRLGPGSPCIDAADNDAVPADEFDLDGDDDTDEPIPFDRDGNPRFVDDPDTDDTGHGTPPIVDMGAYEFQVPPGGDFGGHDRKELLPFDLFLVGWDFLP